MLDHPNQPSARGMIRVLGIRDDGTRIVIVETDDPILAQRMAYEAISQRRFASVLTSANGKSLASPDIIPGFQKREHWHLAFQKQEFMPKCSEIKYAPIPFHLEFPSVDSRDYPN